MLINKEYLASLHNLIKFTPWRCNDNDLKKLLDITETLMWEHEELQNKYSQQLSNHYKHAEMLKGQLITSMLNGGKLNAEEKE
jgi:hypothetical protein